MNSTLKLLVAGGSLYYIWKYFFDRQQYERGEYFAGLDAIDLISPEAAARLLAIKSGPLTDGEKGVLRKYSEDRSFEGPNLSAWETDVWRRAVGDYLKYESNLAAEGIAAAADKYFGTGATWVAPKTPESRPSYAPLVVVAGIAILAYGLAGDRR